MTKVFTQAELDRGEAIEKEPAISQSTRFVEVRHGTSEGRRLDVAALEAAARRAGYAGATQALVAAIGRNSSDADMTRGLRVPGPTGRALVSRLLGVHEDVLWPTEGAR